MSVVHERIQKLLALAERGIGGEAENARRAAELLANRAGIDLSRFRPEVNKPKRHREAVSTHRSRILDCEKIAVVFCCEEFDCEVVMMVGTSRCQLVFLSDRSVREAVEAFKKVSREIMRAWITAQGFSMKRRHKLSFMSGVMRGIQARRARDMLMKSGKDAVAIRSALLQRFSRDDDAPPPPFAVSLRRPQAAKSEPVEPVNNSDFADGFKIGTGIKV